MKEPRRRTAQSQRPPRAPAATTTTTTAPEPPAHPPPRADLPHPLTFFLTTRQRSAVLRTLRRTDPRDRSLALLRSLGLTAEPADPTPHPHPRLNP